MPRLKLSADVLTYYIPEVVQGNFISREQKEFLKLGMSRQQVRDVLGTPLVASVFHEQRWDYVFTIRRQNVQAQSFSVSVWFKGDELERIAGDDLPSETEFVTKLVAQKPNLKVPRLEAKEEDLRKFPVPLRNTETKAAPAPPLMERRRRKALSPLRLDIIPPFRRRNTNQICVLEAPATHIRLHAVQAGPHHMMHQCIDAHTEEVFFLPEYVGPSGQHSLHRVFWPQTISTAPKAPEHEQDVPFDESQDCAGSDADEVAGAAEIKGEAGSLALLSAASAYSPCRTSSASTCFPSSADSFCGASTRKIVMCPAPCAAPVTNFSKQEFVGGGAGKGGVVDAGNGSVLDIMRGGSPGTPCDVAVATASLAARAVTVN